MEKKIELVREVPGTYGLPIIGTILDTVDFFFISGWVKFFSRRRSRHQSDVFKVNLFKPTIVVLDSVGIEPLFASLHLRQDHGFSWAIPAPQLVGEIVPSIFESGSRHDLPKQLYMDMLRSRSSTLLEEFSTTAARFDAKWTRAERFSFQTELETFAIEFLFEWYFGMRPDATSVRELYLGLFSHVFWRITQYVPGSSYRRSLKTYQELLADLRGSPSFRELMNVARGLGMSDSDEVAKQLLFVTGMNSFLGIQNFFKSTVGELSARPALREDLRGEMRATNIGWPPASLKQLSALHLPILDKTLREIARLHPPVSFLFGRATQDQVITIRNGQKFRVRKDELLMGVLPVAMRDHHLFADPDRFDPSRFDVPEARHGLIWPRGHQDDPVTATDRTCPGKDVSMEITKLLCLWLLSRYDWDLRDPPTWNQRFFGLNVAAPEGAMVVDRFRRVDTRE